ncbi:MAG TPA: bifunctional diaminohydroxyphosphoribosylaminopyrimidine deaminase/5-amino-6-(5-phosphoribosylamino)uracil reductase RibD [Xanthobacteraceae bacterium]|nr:bifunctional diaminohydroxyphosphoribosylaminopyrimidine deaminase/5-amino-6-(5-phosphoribosylamino)uracil reductase RibD [Xanthobacteraceae bacterium]
MSDARWFDERFMSLALALGRRGLGNAWPNPAVGAVVVRHDGEPVIVGRGWTQPGGRPHAETEALRRAGAAARGATLYATLEPCSHQGKTPPCTDAIIAAGIVRVVSAIEDPNALAGRGHALLRECGITVDVGVGAAEARRAHAGHIRRVCDHRPHVSLKLAVSADGKAGLADRKPVSVTGEAARARVHLMRAMNDAILVGVGTALADDPQLTCRLPGMAAFSPVRVVLDAGLRLPVTGALVRSAPETPVWVIADERAPAEAEAVLVARGVEVFRIPAASPSRLVGEGWGGGSMDYGAAVPQSPTPSPAEPRYSDGSGTQRNDRNRQQPISVGGGEKAADRPSVTRRPSIRARLDLLAALRLLAEQGITRLMVEGGPTVAAAFLAADLVDEAVLLRGPTLIGPDGIDALEALPLAALTASPKLRSLGIETVGADTLETFERL